MPQRQTSHKVLQNTAVSSLVALLALSSLPVGAQSGLVKTANVAKVSDAKSTGLKAPVLRPIPPAVTEATLPAKNVAAPKAVVGEKKDTSSTKKAAVKPTRIKRSSEKILRNGLIPPPPPIMSGGAGFLGFPFAQPVDYLSLKELEGRKKELSLRLAELESMTKENERQISERKERANLFKSLYAEGVVSRKELETATREASDFDRDVRFRVEELDSARQSMKAVTNRLDSLKKQERANKPPPVSSKKKHSK
ncbi:MAG: hypothetical protein IAF58_22405 [Leptolyngbya sp.]|nr:hypothetical protein [Candidatus Melainabacteria bacterium]